MKNFILILVSVFSAFTTVSAQDSMMTKDTMMKKDFETTAVFLEQTKGAFTEETLVLEEGDYIFEISNNNVGHPVGFVFAPKVDPEAHNKTAYVIKAIDTKSKERSNKTTLAKGEYVYFCPLNPTPQHTLIVKLDNQQVLKASKMGRFCYGIEDLV